MHSQNKPTKHTLNYKLKPISLIVFSLFAQQTYAQSEQAQDQVSLVLSQQLADSNAKDSSAKESKPSELSKNKKTAKIMLADASAALKAKAKTDANISPDTPADVDDVLLGDNSSADTKASNNLPSTADAYVTKEFIKTVAATDVETQGTAKTEGQDKPVGTKPVEIDLKEVNVRAKRFYEIGPLPGLGLTKEEIPGNVQSISAKEIKESHSLSLSDLMNKKLQSVNVNDYQGNPFQMDITYRGFTAGPQIGTPQGLSVFFDGIRVNEPFGDVVNWDMIPMNAISSVDVFPGSNPIFGLNTLGGAFTLKTKDGFDNAGFDIDVLTGSYGRRQLQAEGGANNGTFAFFGAANIFLEDGWRDNSPSKVNQFFGKASYRGDKLDLSLSTLLVKTDLVGNGLLPSEQYARDPSSVFTSPDTTKNKLQQFQLSGNYFVNDNFSVTGQVYRRNSKRHQVGADVATYESDLVARRKPKPADPANGTPAEEYTCLLSSTNPYGYKIPDYYLVPINVTAGEDFFIPGSIAGNFVDDYFDNGNIDNSTGSNPNFNSLFNAPITTADGLAGTSLAPNYPDLFELDFNINRNFYESEFANRNSVALPQVPTFVDPVLGLQNVYGTGGGAFQSWLTSGVPGENIISPFVTDGLYFYSRDSNNDLIKNVFVLKPPINSDNCTAAQHSTNIGDIVGGNAYTYKDANGNPVLVDGAGGGIDPATGKGFPGVVEGTPTAIINDNQIDQIVNGGSIQFNWNFEKHKFMVGASIDAASADYSNTSQLGFLTADRAAYLDPAQAQPQFAGAFVPLANNNFEGTNTTKSVYFSETWTPVDNWHFNASGRYNDTQTKNKIAARSGLANYSIVELPGVPDNYNLCPNGDCSNVSTNYRLIRLDDTLGAAETEKFSYYSFNPSLGATWQAKDNLNLYANWAKGTRTPSVIELGCAFDKTPTPDYAGTLVPRSIAERRQCTLPTTLSGDPYLPQIKATTYDVGMRGTWGDGLEWNVGAYQTNLKDDIYFVTVATGAGFFDSIGKTRRRGLEAGLSGKKDKWGFSLNYGLTDATFQDNFLMLSNDNSSSTFVNGYGNVIEVKKGSRMPGVPLHNLNASISYEVTPQWQLGLSAVAHSASYVRGNENNQHQVGVIQDRGLGAVGNSLVQPTSNPGTVPGYATFNLQTSYKFNSEWTATMLVNNLFDKEYFSAGRLGRNQFSPSIYGAIGPDGYNHNSNDWLSTNFIAPAAPRGVWFSLNWQFDAAK
jgi:Fe(3+) dicitrate transport protein